MRIVPDSTVTLYGGVDIDTNEQLVFASKANQTAYFQSKIVRAATPCTTIKKTGRLRLEVPGSVIATCNYLSFVNPSFDNKTVYAAIIDYDYVNNECVEISYVIDFWQTWMFDVTFQDMYIEREHLSQADWTKAETNPYDPTILEFKTSESLPVSPDIEKPYYTYGTSTTDDGVYIGKKLCIDNNITNRNGILMIFSDISLSNADGTSGPGTSSPSGVLATYLKAITYSSNTLRSGLSFIKLSQSVYKYLNDNYPSLIANRTSCSSGWGTSLPMASNSLETPTNYVYIDTTVATSEEYVALSNILGWFTDNYSLNEILGIYPVPNGLMYMSGTELGTATSGVYSVTMPTAKTQNVTNKKLDLYPYSYYRLEAPNGDVKELRMEDFKSAQDAGTNCSVAFILDVVEKPNLMVAPIGYKASGATPNNFSNANVKEGLMFSQFPSLPYSIDAYRMQLASVVNNIIGNNTVDYSYQIQQQQLDIYKGYAGAISGGVGAGFDIVGGNIGSGISKGVDAAFAGTQTQLAQQRAQNEWNMSEDAYKKLYTEGGVDNAINNNFKYCKPAYVASEYHQINGDGITNFNNNSFMDILLLKVTINPTILAQMDTYFSNYGYNSGRFGIPRVINYIHGSSATTDVPHWQTLNNKPTTYIKTTDCRVTHSMRPVAMAIKALFDSGIRMIKGDLV